MKDKVTKLLIKWGNNEQAVQKMIQENFDLAVRCMPEAKASKLADFISANR